MTEDYQWSKGETTGNPNSKSRNAVQAVYRIFKEEGIRTLYKGLNSTILRSVVLNVFQLGMYSQIKTFVLAHGFKE